MRGLIFGLGQHDTDAKYIIVAIYDVSSENPKAFVSYGFVSIDLDYHSDIYDRYQEILRASNRHLRATVLGGGIVKIDKNNKKIRTYGMSGGYGATSMELLQYVVTSGFKDFEHDITITRYIRDRK